MEAKSTVELLEQEECILEQQIQAAVQQFVERRGRHTVDVAVRSALAVREQILSDLTFLHRVTSRARGLDGGVCALARLSLRAAGGAAQCSARHRARRGARAAASRGRLETMMAICEEQEICSQRLQSQDKLLHAISSILGVKPTTDVVVLVKRYAELLGEIEELKIAVEDRFRQKEERLAEIQTSHLPLRSYLLSGPTGAAAERAVCHAGTEFARVKNGDKQNLRKLWQWFLSDPAKLRSVMRATQCESYS